VEAQALAETKGVTVALADRQFNGKLRSSSVLEVRGEGATLQVPLDGSTLALERLERLDPKDVASGSYENPIQRPPQATPAHRTSDITAADRAREVRSEAAFVRVT
jgi:hypothetical protein